MIPTKNLCTADRVIRGIVAVLAIGFGIFYAELLGDVIIQTIVIVFGVLNLISFAAGWCPIYSIANISTCKEQP